MFLCRAIMAVKLSTLSICLGFAFAALNLIGVISPAKFGAAARKFPRSLPIGYILTLGGTAWFMWNVSHESLADFESLKPFLFTLFIGVGLGTCFFVQDFLAVRGLAVVLMIGWLFLFFWDVGILYSLTKDWTWGPLGKPPASQQEKKDKTTPPSSDTTNAPNVPIFDLEDKIRADLISDLSAPTNK